MIVPMKKVSLVILESRRRSALARLRKVGAVHIQSAGKSSQELEAVRENISLIEKTLFLFPQEKAAAGVETAKTDTREALRLAAAIMELAEQRRIKREEAERFVREIEKLEPWGDFNPETLRALNGRGLFIRLYELNRDQARSFPPAGLQYTVFENKVRTGKVVISAREEDFPEGYEAVPAPAKGLSELRNLLTEKEREIESLNQNIAGYFKYKNALTSAGKDLRAVAEFEQASADLASVENRLAWLSGYVPEPKLADLRAAAVTEGWGLLVQDPGGEDTVPTLLYNPQPMRLVKPVMDFLGTVPGYRERDISFFFLIFFSVFFAMIIGDAGYGTLLFGVSVYFSLKTRRKTGYIPDGLILLVLMGFCTMVWGAITGNYFGFQPVSELWPLSQLVIPAISSWEERSTKTVQFICFIIGAIHLSIAHIWNFIVEIRRKPRIRAFSQLGSLFLVLGLYFVVLYMVLDPVKYPVPQAAIIMIVMGYVMVLFLSQQEGNFFMGLLKGLAGFIPTTLGSISVFADIISYIRLFAVGLAGIAIAQSFNDMARGIMTGPVGIVFGIVILVLGHSLNICMSMLSVVVHGIRLNVLEFSNHLGLEWSGFSYDPFRDKGENSPPNN